MRREILKKMVDRIFDEFQPTVTRRQFLKWGGALLATVAAGLRVPLRVGTGRRSQYILDNLTTELQASDRLRDAMAAEGEKIGKKFDLITVQYSNDGGLTWNSGGQRSNIDA